MKISNLIPVAVLAFTLPAAAFAASYGYVDMSGNVRSVEAPSPNVALTTAPDIAMRSGVIQLMDGSLDLGSGMTTTESEAAQSLRSGMRTLLGEHVEYSIDVLREIENSDGDDSDELDDALEDQDRNAEELGDAIGSVYGEAAGTMFEEMFKEHIVSSNDYTRALVDDDEEAAEEALIELGEYLVEITDFLAGANPNIDNATLLAALRAHEDLLNDASAAHIDGDHEESEDLEDEAIEQIMGGADYLVDAIIMQFPEKF